MPRTSMPWRRNDAAAVEITALAAGAGPPAKRIATRRIGRGLRDGLGVEGEAEGMEGRLPFMFAFGSISRSNDSIDPAGEGEVALGQVAGITPGSLHSSRGGGGMRASRHRPH